MADHPTPVQGEALPRYVLNHSTGRMEEFADGNWVEHAQATAEIARLQGEVERLSGDLAGIADSDELVTQTITTLRTQLSDTTGQVGKLLELIHSSKDAIYHHGTAPTLDEFDAALNSTAQESAE